MAKIQQKRSSALADASTAKAPTADQLDYGELAVNFSSADPAIFIKNSANNVVRLGGAGSIGSSEVESVNGKTGAVVLAPSDIGAATAAQGAKADTALQPDSDIDVNSVSIKGTIAINSSREGGFTRVVTPFYDLASLPDISGAP